MNAPDSIPIPTWAGPLAFTLLLSLAAVMTFHQLRMRLVWTSNAINLTSRALPVDVSSLAFSMRVEEITKRSGPIALDRPVLDDYIQEYLVARVSFRTNHAVQIASLRLQIDVDRGKSTEDIQPHPDFVQGFPLPHTLSRSGTYDFQFQLPPGRFSGRHKLLLKVLAGGRWYCDGPRTIKF